MAPIGYPLWLWFKNLPPAFHWGAGIVALYAAFRVWLWRKIKGERREAASEAREEVVEQIKEQTDEAIQRVEDDRAAVERLNAEQLRKLAGDSPNNRGRLQNPEAD